MLTRALFRSLFDLPYPSGGRSHYMTSRMECDNYAFCNLIGAARILAAVQNRLATRPSRVRARGCGSARLGWTRRQGVVTPIVRVGPFATGVKMQSRGQAGFLALVKRSRGLSGSVNGQDQLSPKPIPTRIPILQATRTILSTLFISAGCDLTVTGACARPNWADFSPVLEPDTVIQPLNARYSKMCARANSRKRGRGWDRHRDDYG